MRFEVMMAFGAASITLAFIGLAAYVVAKVSAHTPEHLPRLFVSMAVFFSAVPAVIYALYALAG
ncbi:hypothetical protein [Actinomadura nitritigenes]|uniref:Uncharacterized protein n=1 Tax=Actinomadura nitritigenes TaxID=134602 RepID=A0ABS3RCG1_9ACTN|nr:hypothetical protein [Actinomadura nitritigenes]MBO2443274.1 hypothetical protein [Actinomadura nitritigenes]